MILGENVKLGAIVKVAPSVANGAARTAGSMIEVPIVYIDPKRRWFQVEHVIKGRDITGTETVNRFRESFSMVDRSNLAFTVGYSDDTQQLTDYNDF